MGSEHKRMRIGGTRYESLTCDMLIPNRRHEGEGERGCMNPLMPDLSTRQRCVVILSPGRQPPGPIEQVHGWVSDSIWTFWTNYTSCSLSGFEPRFV